jgi:hypothetical protein
VLLYVAIKLYRIDRDGRILVFLLAGIGAQLMLIVSAKIAHRTLLPSLLCWIIIILISVWENIKFNFVVPILTLVVSLAIMSNYAFLLCIMLTATYLTSQKSVYKNLCIMSCFSVIAFISCFNTWTTIQGYQQNSAANEFNLKAIRKFNSSNNTDKNSIGLKKLENPLYGFLLPFNLEWTVDPFKDYYGIPDKTQLIYDTNIK